MKITDPRNTKINFYFSLTFQIKIKIIRKEEKRKISHHINKSHNVISSWHLFRDNGGQRQWDGIQHILWRITIYKM